jgi:hypothetical protein
MIAEVTISKVVMIGGGTGCGREAGDYKNNNSNTVFTKL